MTPADLSVHLPPLPPSHHSVHNNYVPLALPGNVSAAGPRSAATSQDPSDDDRHRNQPVLCPHHFSTSTTRFTTPPPPPHPGHRTAAPRSTQSSRPTTPCDQSSVGAETNAAFNLPVMSGGGLRLLKNGMISASVTYGGPNLSSSG